jgi:glycosyltransferase involved in cell wall biosynthesis
LRRLLHNKGDRRSRAGRATKRADAGFGGPAWPLGVKECLESLHAKPRARSILLLNDFSASDPLGGGEIRINRLYSRIAEEYAVVLLCLGNGREMETRRLSDNFVELSVPKTPAHVKEEGRINSQFWISATDVVNSYMCEHNSLLRQSCDALLEACGVIVLVHPYMAKLLPRDLGKPVIYESLNYEYGLKEQLLGDHPSFRALLQQVETVERIACEASRMIITVSDCDQVALAEHYALAAKPFVTIANGVDADRAEYLTNPFTKVKRLFSDCPVIAFVGSGHAPNRHAVEYILAHLAQQLPDCYFVIVGSISDAFVGRRIPSNVLLFGALRESYKNVLLRVSDIAINPLTEGSGSNLKLAEYFSWGLPTITTPFGARGYTIGNEREAIICELNDFSARITQLCADASLRERLGANARDYARRDLDWGTLARRYIDAVLNAIPL